ncbi:ATP-binding cassette domain-containing protein [Litorivicinus sp.]|nr:ATP-binding cassette domain-containing protein [Litorivicinus sp.]
MKKIVLSDLGLEYSIQTGQRKSFRVSGLECFTGGYLVPDTAKPKSKRIRALSNVSMTIHDGERWALLGHNGAGKTSLLKVMAGIYSPTSGTIQTHGEITPMISQSLGFELEDTGFENIISGGMRLGRTRQEMIDIAPDIAMFSELGEFLDLPLKTYSSGMLSRLSFSVATSIEPDILLLDEGFGAADHSFASKVASRTADLIANTGTLILASHSETLVKSMCEKAAFFARGELQATGPVDEVYREYISSLRT